MKNKKKTARANFIMVFITVLVILTFSTTGRAEENGLNSQGKIIFDNGTKETNDDVIFDSGDFNKLAFICR